MEGIGTFFSLPRTQPTHRPPNSRSSPEETHRSQHPENLRLPASMNTAWSCSFSSSPSLDSPPPPAPLPVTHRPQGRLVSSRAGWTNRARSTKRSMTSPGRTTAKICPLFDLRGAGGRSNPFFSPSIYCGRRIVASRRARRNSLSYCPRWPFGPSAFGGTALSGGALVPTERGYACVARIATNPTDTCASTPSQRDPVRSAG